MEYRHPVLNNTHMSNRPLWKALLADFRARGPLPVPIRTNEQAQDASKEQSPRSQPEIPYRVVTSLALDFPHTPALQQQLTVLPQDNDPGSMIAYVLTSLDADGKLNEAQPDDHLEMAIDGGTFNATIQVYFAKRFHLLREWLLDRDQLFLRSITATTPWSTKGGKSGSRFFKTANDRFILKQILKAELDSFLNLAQMYFSYYQETIQDLKKPSILVKILGIYRVNHTSSGSNTNQKSYVVIMENLFYNRQITQRFDLKGSMRNRLAPETGTNGNKGGASGSIAAAFSDDVVLLDENLLKMTNDRPLYITDESKQTLSCAIANDSAFLAAHSVMDYSLLVGVDEEHRELVVGIIDYVRPFTWDKQVESIVKSAVGSKDKTPTIIAPDMYKIRFCQAMDRYFQCSPTHHPPIPSEDEFTE